MYYIGIWLEISSVTVLYVNLDELWSRSLHRFGTGLQGSIVASVYTIALSIPIGMQPLLVISMYRMVVVGLLGLAQASTTPLSPPRMPACHTSSPPRMPACNPDTPRP